MRPYKSTDSDALRQMLEEAGIEPEEMEFEERETYIYNEGEGFFTYRKNEWGFPVLTHFYVKKEHRNNDKHAGRNMFRAFLKEIGYGKFIIITKDDMPYINKVINKYLKVKPYADKDGYNFYLAGGVR